MTSREVNNHAAESVPGHKLFQIYHYDACINLFIDIESNGKKYTRSLYHHYIATMISDLYKADIPSRSERIIRGRPRASNSPPVTEIGGDI